MASIDKPLPNDGPSVTLTIRLLMQGKEVGSIIGKKGEIVKRFREESGARINISDGSCPERIVTITGNTDGIIKAFTLICSKFEEDLQNTPTIGSGSVPKPPITLRLIVPASQCGSIIGKGGSKIKEIREITGASIQVASEMLPNSTERAVTISGANEAITQCIYHICCIMLESPPKGATIPYRPKPQLGSSGALLAGGQALGLQGNMSLPSHPDLPKLGAGLGGLAALGIGGVTGGGGVNPAVTSLTALAALAGSQIRPSGANNSGNNSQTHEMTVPNELIGCIIGKGGTKIAEIRQMSGAMIRISNCEDREGGKTDRTITITGTGEAVALAQYLINTSIELHKATMEAQGGVSNGGGERSGNSSGATGSSNSNSALSAIPLLKLLATQPNLLTGALGGIGGLSGLGDILSGGGGSHIQTTGVHRNPPHKSFSPRLRSVANSPSSNSNSARVKTERNKFAPY